MMTKSHPNQAHAYLRKASLVSVGCDAPEDCELPLVGPTDADLEWLLRWVGANAMVAVAIIGGGGRGALGKRLLSILPGKEGGERG